MMAIHHSSGSCISRKRGNCRVVRARGLGATSQHLLHAVMTGAAVKVDRADGSALPQCEVRILRFEINDALAHHHRQRAWMARPVFLCGTKQAEEALPV